MMMMGAPFFFFVLVFLTPWKLEMCISSHPLIHPSTMFADDIIDNEVQNLSGGELQRVAITLCLGTPAV